MFGFGISDNSNIKRDLLNDLKISKICQVIFQKKFQKNLFVKDFTKYKK